MLRFTSFGFTAFFAFDRALILELRDPYDRALLRELNEPSLFVLLEGRARCPRTFAGSFIDFVGFLFLGTVDPLTPRADETFDDLAELRALRPVLRALFFVLFVALLRALFFPLFVALFFVLSFALSFELWLLRPLFGGDTFFLDFGAKLTRVSSAFLKTRLGSSLAFRNSSS